MNVATQYSLNPGNAKRETRNAERETRNAKRSFGFLLAGLLRFCRKEPGYFASPEFSILTGREPVVSHVTNADAAEFDN